MKPELKSLILTAAAVCLLPDNLITTQEPLPPISTLPSPTPTRSPELVFEKPISSPEKPISSEELVRLVVEKMSKVKSLEIEVSHPDLDKYYDGTTVYRIDIPSQKRSIVRNFPNREGRNITEEQITIGNREWARTNQLIIDSVGGRSTVDRWLSYHRRLGDGITWDITRFQALISDAKIDEGIKEVQCSWGMCSQISAQRVQNGVLPSADIFFLVDSDTHLLVEVKIKEKSAETKYKFGKYNENFEIKPPV